MQHFFPMTGSTPNHDMKMKVRYQKNMCFQPRVVVGRPFLLNRCPQKKITKNLSQKTCRCNGGCLRNTWCLVALVVWLRPPRDWLIQGTIGVPLPVYPWYCVLLGFLAKGVFELRVTKKKNCSKGRTKLQRYWVSDHRFATRSSISIHLEATFSIVILPLKTSWA